MAPVSKLHFLLLNGPPGSGKDTLGRLVQQQHEGQVALEKFVLPLRQYMFTVHGFDAESLERYKDTNLTRLNGHTPREVMIDISERHYKHMFGQGVYGRMLWNRSQLLSKRVVIVTDLGFPTELAELRTNNCHTLTIHLHADGKTFEGDSRSYVFGHGPTVAVKNEWGRPQKAASEIERLIAPWLSE